MTLRLHCAPCCLPACLLSCADTYRKNDVLSIQESIVNHVEYTLARTRHQFDDFECYQAAAFSLRDRLIEMWNDTQTYYKYVAAAAPCSNTVHKQQPQQLQQLVQAIKLRHA